MRGALVRISGGIKCICLFFSLSFLVASLGAAWYIDAWGEILSGWVTILFSPCPLVTDYFRLGNLASVFFNAGICGLSCCAMMVGLHSECRASYLAGFFLVVAHCFYGLNFLNMWPPIVGIFLFCRFMKIDFHSNLDMAMFSTAFGPFVSEILFEYPLTVSPVPGQITVLALVSVALLTVFLGFVIPAMLPGALRMHKGYNLYNGGLAFGLIGLFIYAFMYKTMGLIPPELYPTPNPVYAAHGNSYIGFAEVYFILVFGICLLTGWFLNGKSFYGYRDLLAESGHRTDFLERYGVPIVLINLGFYGLMMVLYFSLVIIFTEGAGATGATVGVTLAAMTFVATGQHPKNVWPVLSGYLLLSMFVTIVCTAFGLEIPWSLSTQGYLNGAAFATGLCPLTGHYGRKVGAAAGFMCAVMCTSTSAMHGGFVLYNGGLTAGITALIMVPCLEYYFRNKKTEAVK